MLTSRRLGIVCVLALILLPSAAQARPAAEIAAERLAVAKEGFSLAMESVVAGVSRLDVVSGWSRRWAEAALAAEPNPADRIAALREHLARMKQIEDRAQAMHEAGLMNRLDLLSARHARIEAELWLAHEEALQKKP